MRLCVRALLLWLTCLAVQAHPHGRARASSDAQDALLAPKVVRVRDKQDEPTCEQLKAMWRFSKRQARAPEIINDISSYRDPFTYNEWPAYQAAQLQLQAAAPRYRDVYNVRPNFVGPYGRVVHKAPPGLARVTPNYEEQVARLYGVLSDGSSQPLNVLRYSGRGRVPPVAPPQQGSFQHLKELIRTERARELQAQRAAEQLAARAAVLKDIAAGGARREEAHHGNNYNEQESRRLQELDFPLADDPQPRRQRPTAGRQFSRYSDLMPPPERRSLVPVPTHRLYEYPDSLADLMLAYY